MIGMIAAINADRVIGKAGQIPWHYSADFKRFKAVTQGTTIIMGRLTWESMGSKPLPNRRNVVVSRSAVPNVESFRSVAEAIANATGDVWIVGGAEIYRDGLKHADAIDLTLVPDAVSIDNHTVQFPEIPVEDWEIASEGPFPGDERLRHRVYRRRGAK